MSTFAIRTTLYSLILVIGVFESILALFTSLVFGFIGPLSLRVFPGIAAGWGIITWIWLSVLLSYNNRPLSSVFVTRSSTHYKSLAFLSVGWLAFSIMLAKDIPLACARDTEANHYIPDGVTCGTTAGTFSGAFILLILCALSAVVIYRSAVRSGLGLGVNVAYEDSKFHHMKDIDDTSLRTLTRDPQMDLTETCDHKITS